MSKKSRSHSRDRHTVLFKKLLSSFFSKESMMSIGMNPASIFVSFVSSRQFFGLINRRMTEHYKLNNLGINLENFDNEVGIGDNPTISVRNIDIYYAYNSSANFVGYKFYNPNTIATGLSMFFAAQTLELFEDKKEHHFNAFVNTIYALVFLYVSHIKTFPQLSEEKQFDRFVSVFWELYNLTLKNKKQTITTQELKNIKLLLTEDLHTMFSLFHTMKLLSNYFNTTTSNHGEMMERLLAGETQHHKQGHNVQQYLSQYEDIRTSKHITSLEEKILKLIMPAESSLQYLFGKNETKLVTKHIISTIYPPNNHEDLMASFVKDGNNTQSLLDVVIDFNQIKSKFFEGLQHYIKARITNFNKESSSQGDENIEEVLDSFISQLSEGDEVDLKDLPKSIKIQSITFDRLINFYISFLGGFWIARGDSGYLRTHKQKLLQQLLNSYPIFGSQHETLEYYTKFFKLYEKNVFYYQYVFNHIRSGKESFVLPTHGSSIDHHSNTYIIQLLNESHWARVLQDFSPTGIKLYIKKEDILEEFKDYFGTSISAYLQQSDKEFVESIYKPYAILQDNNHTPLSDLLISELNTKDIERLKDRLYHLDFWLAQNFIQKLVDNKIQEHYDKAVLLGMFATIKETFFGFLLYVTYLQNSEESHQKNYAHDAIIRIYVRKILQAKQNNYSLFYDNIVEILSTYKELFTLWTLLDDNQDYMYIGFNNRTSWINNNNTSKENIISDDDEIRLLGYLKHITHYNRRFLIPQQETS